MGYDTNIQTHIPQSFIQSFIQSFSFPENLIILIPSFTISKSAMALFPSSSGHDLKSLLINFFTTVLFLSPLLWYFHTVSNQVLFALNCGTFAIAFVYPPIGWLRPHPYSDFRSNKIRET